jgi:sugar (pentulose or hexulose) kinase
VARAQHPHAFVEGLPTGHIEQHPEQWWDAVAATAREVLQHVDRTRIAGIGVSGQQHGAVVLDGSGAVVRPAKLWCDTATAAEARELSERTGRAVPTGFTASKLLWLARHEGRSWAAVQRVLLPHDFINLRLTGEASMEFGDASGTGFFAPEQRRFDPAAMAAIDPRLSSMLPALRPVGELAGRLSKTAAERTGLPAGIPVAPGGGDNMMSAIGSGATRAGVVVVSLGTSGTIFTRTERCVVDPKGSIAPFCSSDGAWLPLLCVMNLTGVSEEVKLLTGLSHAELSKLAADVPPGCAGLLWLPFLVGERVPDLPLATGTLLGLRPGLLRAGHLYRAALEGTSLNLGAGLDRLRGTRAADRRSPRHRRRFAESAVAADPRERVRRAGAAAARSGVGGARRRAAGGMVRATPRGREEPRHRRRRGAVRASRSGNAARCGAAVAARLAALALRHGGREAAPRESLSSCRAWQHVAFDGAGPPAIPWWHVDTSQDRFGVAGQGYPSSADARHDARRHPRFRSGLLPAR